MEKPASWLVGNSVLQGKLLIASMASPSIWALDGLSSNPEGRNHIVGKATIGQPFLPSQRQQKTVLKIQK